MKIAVKVGAGGLNYISVISEAKLRLATSEPYMQIMDLRCHGFLYEIRR